MYKLTPKLALAAAAALMALTGTAASAQMNQTRTTTTVRTMEQPHGTMERTTVRTHTVATPHHRMATNRSWHSNKRHCKTWWSHGRKMRSCKTMMRHM